MKRLFFLLLFLYTIGAFSQEKIRSLADLKGKKDLKVGLVLSGGGAKGLAHIAALEAIEKAGVEIDYIGGTSMGAIVGGLYAAGYSAQQLDSIFHATDLEEIIQDNVPRSAQTFYEKENRDRYMVSLALRDGKFALPAGLTQGVNLYNFLSQLTYRVRKIDDFSKLPIPFLCMATDVETGEEVVLEHGDLAQAIMASGSFPTLFAPVDVEGRYLTDGGVMNNYPVDEVRAKGMDVIIGVDVQSPLKKRKDLRSANSVLLQITGYKIANDMKEKREKTDIYIHPDMSGYNVISFQDGQAIIDSGRVATKKVLPHLYWLKRHLKKKDPDIINTRIPDSLRISNITFSGNKHYSDAYLRGKLGFQWNEKISFKDLKDGVQNIMATQNFRGINYHICSTDEGEELRFILEEAPAQTWVKMSLHYDNLYQTSILLNLSRSSFLQKDDFISFDFIAGDNLRYKFDYYVDKGFYTSYGFQSRYDHFRRDISFNGFSLTTGDTNLALSRLKNQLYLQSIFFRRKFLVGAGVEHELYKAKVQPDNFNEQVNYYSLFSYLRYDSLDNALFPTEGLYFDARGHWYLHSTGYGETINPIILIKADIGGAWRITDRLSGKAMCSAGFHLGLPNAPFLQYVFGGQGDNFFGNILPFYGYDYLSFGNYDFLKGELSFNYRFYKKNYIKAIANIANANDNMFAERSWFAKPKYTGYALGLSSNTILGPIELKATYSPETDKFLWLFNIGFWF
ncbi:patatin-like phospholipase family protein [Capnocytophaga granulosa]|uniref:patatin-like phospholipase family protein n=1 Tax=Capnocytophaga granulosa TaxID=45242 RepID=UPI003C70827D